MVIRMKQLEIDFRTNYKGSDYNCKIALKCSDKNDLIVVQKMLWDYMQKRIDEVEDAHD